MKTRHARVDTRRDLGESLGLEAGTLQSWEQQMAMGTHEYKTPDGHRTEFAVGRPESQRGESRERARATCRVVRRDKREEEDAKKERNFSRQGTRS